MVLKAGIGETGPLLFKLPQSLSQLFRQLLRATLLGLGSRVVSLQRRWLAGSRATRTRITAIGTKMVGPGNLRVYFRLQPKELDSAKKYVIEKTV